MKRIDFKKSYEELDRQIKLCDEQRITASKRKTLAHDNQFEDKFMLKAVFGIVFYGISFTCIKQLALTPNWILPTIIIGGSIATGIIGEKFVSAAKKTKEKFQAFSNAKTDKEKFEEETKYAIELEKAKNRKKALERIKLSLTGIEHLVNSLSSRYEIKDKSLPTLKESRKSVTSLQGDIQRDFVKLDALSTKSVLNKNFSKQRSVYETICNNVLKTLLGAIAAFIFIGFPVNFFGGLLSLGLKISSAAFIAGGILTYGYTLKRTFERTQVFNKFNSSLDKDGLTYYQKDPDELEEIKSSIDTLIEKISIGASQLQEEICIQESINDAEKWPVEPSLEHTQSIGVLAHEEERALDQVGQTLPALEQGRAFTIQQQ